MKRWVFARLILKVPFISSKKTVTSDGKLCSLSLVRSDLWDSIGFLLLSSALFNLSVNLIDEILKLMLALLIFTQALVFTLLVFGLAWSLAFRFQQWLSGLEEPKGSSKEPCLCVNWHIFCSSLLAYVPDLLLQCHFLFPWWPALEFTWLTLSCTFVWHLLNLGTHLLCHPLGKKCSALIPG